MSKRKTILTIVAFTAAGAFIGWITGYAWEHLLKNHKTLQTVVLGGVIGFLCVPVYRWFAYGGRDLNMENVEVKVPLVGLTMKLKVSEANRLVGWKIFVEAATRVSTQPLGSNEGIVREALQSLYKLFDIVRTELKSATATKRPIERDENTVQTYALRMLNDALRPMLSRWHPRLSKWEETKLPEADWPLAVYCRDDLESTRKIILAYTWGLGKILKMADLEQLLPPEPRGAKPQLHPIDTIENRAKEFESHVSGPQKEAGWHIYVELVSRIATQPLADQGGSLKEALTSLNSLFEIIRDELKKIPPMPKEALPQQPTDTVVEVSLRILNKHLRPFLAKWHPRLSNWEKQNPDKAESYWPEAEGCREELEKTRQATRADVRKLAEIIRIRDFDTDRVD
jgi:hypothetical protein